jgi:hypothetical protein
MARTMGAGFGLCGEGWGGFYGAGRVLQGLLTPSCDARVKSNILQKRCYVAKKILKVFLGISVTNVVIPPKFYNKIKIRIIYIVPFVYF